MDMAKKGLLVLILAVFVAGGAFAQFGPIGISVGGGGLFDMSFGNGLKMPAWKTEIEGTEIEVKAGSAGENIFSFGAFGFVDATYAVFDVSFAYGIGRGFSVYDGKRETDDKNMGYVQLGFSLMGKFPIDLGMLTVFPLAGFNYNLVLSASYDGDTIDWGSDSAAGMLSQFGILIGGGLDFPITNDLFLRGELLFQLRFSNKMMRDYRDALNKEYEDVKDYAKASTTLGWGPRIKIGVGYRLF
jgi:hypothetical protein